MNNKKDPHYINNIIIVALSFLLACMLFACNQDDLADVSEPQFCDASPILVGKYISTPNQGGNFIYYFGSDGEHFRFQDGIKFYDGTYLQDGCEVIFEHEEYGIEEATILHTELEEDLLLDYGSYVIQLIWKG